MMVKRYAPQEFVERLHNEIYRSGKTLEALAGEVGVARKTLRDYSNGVCMPNSLTLMRLCKALNVSADYLLFGKGIEKAHTGNKGLGKSALGKATDEEI